MFFILFLRFNKREGEGKGGEGRWGGGKREKIKDKINRLLLVIND